MVEFDLALIIEIETIHVSPRGEEGPEDTFDVLNSDGVVGREGLEGGFDNFGIYVPLLHWMLIFWPEFLTSVVKDGSLA